MKKLVKVFTMVALMMMSSLTVQAKDAETSEEKVQRMISGLEDAKRPAGKAYPNEDYSNPCHEPKIEVCIDIMRDDWVSVDFASENLYYIENTPTDIGKVAYVREGEWNYWESSEGFGSGKSGTVETAEAVIVMGVSYLDEGGNILSSNFDDSEEIKFADLRMLHIRSIEGDDLGWIWPLYLVDPHD